MCKNVTGSTELLNIQEKPYHGKNESMLTFSFSGNFEILCLRKIGFSCTAGQEKRRDPHGIIAMSLTNVHLTPHQSVKMAFVCTLLGQLSCTFTLHKNIVANILLTVND